MPPEHVRITTSTNYARVLSPRGIYPAESIYFGDAAYIGDPGISFSVCNYRAPTGSAEDGSFSELEWLNPMEARLYGSLLLAMGCHDGYCAFYPYPIAEPLPSHLHTTDTTWFTKTVQPYLAGKLKQPDILDSPRHISDRNEYRWHADIALPPAVGGPDYTFRTTGINYDLARTLYDAIDVNDAILVRGLTTLIKAGMLQYHNQFREPSMCLLFICLEVSFRLVIRALKAKGISNPTSEDAMTYIHDAFNEVGHVDKYFEEYYEGRTTTFHPESRYGVYPHAPLLADDYYYLYYAMQEIYAYLICGYVHPKHEGN